MKNGIVDIDHLMISVKDSQRAGDTFERMGFTVTPRSHMPGLSNRLICFDSGYQDRNNFLEFLALDDRRTATPFMYDILDGEERPASLVMASHDARRSADELRGDGFETLQSIAFKRDWVLPSGEILSPQFVATILRTGSSPIHWNVCEYINPEVYKRSDFVRHRNSASRLAAVVAVAAQPDDVAKHFTHAWGAHQQDMRDGAISVQVAAVRLDVYTPDALTRRFPGLEQPRLPAEGARTIGALIAVDDRAALQRTLAESGMLTGSSGEWPFILPQSAHGCLVAFEASSGLR